MDLASEKSILWFEEIDKFDTNIVGGKTANLGEMTVNTKVPIPYGFAITSHAYLYFIEKTKLREKIAGILQELKDPNDTRTLQRVGRSIREGIMKSDIPLDLQKRIVEAYRKLVNRAGDQEVYVAIRSSATAEDLADASFAGQQDTFLNIKGEDQVIAKVRECYASLFTDRALFYRVQKNYDHLSVALSVAVQIMVHSKASGVMFTLNVANGDANTILIEAGYGLGEFLVQGRITPDEYMVRKSGLEIISKGVPSKLIQLIRKSDGGTVEVPVPDRLRDRQVITDGQIKELAKYALAIEKHYERPMDIEWGLDERTNKLWILQARPETVWALKGGESIRPKQEVAAREIIVQGLPASPGIASGKAQVITSIDNISEFKESRILITDMTSPDWVLAMRKAKAIVTNSGGMTCHAAIVSRELGIPCIVGTTSKGKAATKVISTDDELTVDATNGVVYKGLADEIGIREEVEVMSDAGIYPVTGTKILVNLGDPQSAVRVAKMPCDGVGLLREEFIWVTSIGQHPLHLVETGQPEVVVERLAEGIRKICQAMNPRPVVLRFSDFKTNEYRDLKGGAKYEPEETSPLLGWRGSSRYYDPKYRKAFELEVRAVKKVREEFGLKNLWVMLPFVRNVDEVERVTQIMKECGLKRGSDFKVWLMAEIPSNVILADKFNEFVDGYSIGSNDLTMLILGCDRDNATVAHIFDERDLAVKRSVKHLIDVAHKEGKTVSICGQAPSVHGPEYIRFLIESGIDSISVNPDAIVQVRKWVASIEQRLILEKSIGRGLRKRADLEWG